MDLVRAICEAELECNSGRKTKVEKMIQKAPEGTLLVSSSNGTIQYYQKIEKKRLYLSKKKKPKQIAALAQKDYDIELYKELGRYDKQLKKMLSVLPKADPEAIYNRLPNARKELVIPHILSDEEYVKEWLGVSYRGKVFEEETPLIETDRGEKVRSKSEKIIADKLYSMGIPYRYEYPLSLKGFGTVYPDFTLLKMSGRKEIYLEHFGMMDNPAYSQKMVMKLQTYARNHIYPGNNLILTFETLKTPLDMKYVEEMLRELVL